MAICLQTINLCKMGIEPASSWSQAHFSNLWSITVTYIQADRNSWLLRTNISITWTWIIIFVLAKQVQFPHQCITWTVTCKCSEQTARSGLNYTTLKLHTVLKIKSQNLQLAHNWIFTQFTAEFQNINTESHSEILAKLLDVVTKSVNVLLISFSYQSTN